MATNPNIHRKRPVRAPNHGAAGNRPPVRPVKAEEVVKKKTTAGKVAKFMFAPEIGRSFQGVKFAWDILVNLVAQIYVMVKLIPADHPCADFRNAGQHGLKEVVATAFKSLKWRRDDIPQIIMFFAVLAFLFFVALSLITVIMNVGVNVAHAQGVTGNSANDVLNTIFNLEGNSMVPTAFGEMLKAYSRIILILAGLILLWTIVTTVVESMREGKPFGKSFNGTWAPMRLVFALGILIPLSSGLNSGQYITLYLAKWGSDMASEVYKQFAISLQRGQGVVVSQLSVQPQKALEGLFNLEACIAHYNIKNPGSIVSSPSIQDDPQDSRKKILDFSGNSLGTRTGCGKIKFFYDAQASKPDEILLNKQWEFFLANRDNIQSIARNYIDTAYNPQSSSYFQGVRTSELKDKMKAIEKDYAKKINAAAQIAVQEENDNLGKEMEASIRNLGWVTAPTWLQRIADRNSDVAGAHLSLPDVSTTGQNYAGVATGKISASATTEEIDSWQEKSASEAADRGQNALQEVFSGIPQMGPALYKALIIDSSNPFAALVAFGKTLFRAAEIAYAAWIAIAVALGASATSIVGNQINVGPALIQSITPMITAFIGMAFMTGMMLGFMLPLIPTIRFIFAILGWIIMVFVGVMGMPLFALAHLKTGGEGWIGQLQVASAYNMIIGIVIRPTLIILGFIASLVVFNTIMKMAGTLLYMAASQDNAGLSYNTYMNAIDAGDPIAQLMKIFIFSTVVQAIANSCFKLVDIVPSQAMTWMGTGPMSSAVEGGADEATQLTQNLTGQFSQAYQGRLQTRATEAMENMRQLRQAKNKISPVASDETKLADDSGGGPDTKGGLEVAGKDGSSSGLSANASHMPNVETGADQPALPGMEDGSSQASGAGVSAQGQQLSLPGTEAAGRTAATATSAMASAASAGAAASSGAAGGGGGATKTAAASGGTGGGSGAAAGGSGGAGSAATAATSGAGGGGGSGGAAGGGGSGGATGGAGDQASAGESGAANDKKGKSIGNKELIRNPFKFQNVRRTTQNQAIGWGIAMGVMQSLIPGGRIIGALMLERSFNKQIQAESKKVFDQAAAMPKTEEEKASESATGGGVGADDRPQGGGGTAGAAGNAYDAVNPATGQPYQPWERRY